MSKTTGELDVYGAGQLDVLSVGRGHLRLSFAPGDDAELDKAKRIITDMLARGFAIFIERTDGTTQRVKSFDAKRNEYLVADVPEPDYPEPPVEQTSEPTEAVTRPKPRKAVKKALTRVPVKTAKATAVGRTAGG